MKPIKFKQCNTDYAEYQDEFQTLPAYIDNQFPDGCVTSCWQLTWSERFILFWQGKLWLQQLTFHNGPLQPQRPSVKCPFIEERN